jgi:hypothetical protein
MVSSYATPTGAKVAKTKIRVALEPESSPAR